MTHGGEHTWTPQGSYAAGNAQYRHGLTRRLTREKYRVSKKALVRYFLVKCGTDVRRSFSSPRRATATITQLLD